ncbi:hypothetical protein BDM02DRAFT_3150655 [Thelephora ganbajun]|uniref:Uncharacterized protein n=1 Tax=Thelephora ganbajun TaxID=370292 RepID=A0ACB6Z3B3_THEGA|nr:hypothetical protein BDM02DRAFT_3150655 [Thelephora ganbajun]
MSPSSSRDRNVEDTYEAQNDQRLDGLHSKIRTLRGVTTDIHRDVESQNLLLDESGNAFSSFATSLSNSTRRVNQAFGLGPGTPKQYRILVYSIGSILFFWLLWKILSWLLFRGSLEPIPTGESYGI